MSTYGTAVIADTETQDQAQAVIANLKNLAALTIDQHSLKPVAQVGQCWRASGYVGMSVAEMVGTGLFAGVTTGRAVVADDMDEFGGLWTAWRVDGAEPAIIYRKYLSSPDGSVDPTLATTDRAGIDAALEMARLWDADPAAVTAVESQFDEMSQSLGRVGTPFMPWLNALGLEWPV
ncbi:hypothetical protein OHB26_33555 [Nocardia sp. NBC_01503]|uniref:hypothetical protein n=1 Tax=Nocardia sp. NBC_01503 TaxID=2975997 RepID=UPI002E7B9D9E|nr:hypothetical protein [Nocardia sp. NBC_01503]WTL31778.1 hypothetical protein OHB26_33555 [Nocardia sp. NBC_01503]